MIAGSIVQGIVVRIDADIEADSLKTGKFVCIVDGANRFFSLVADLALHMANPDIALFPPTSSERLLTGMLKKREMYITADIKPMVMLDAENKLWPVKTVPAHFAPVFEAQKEDIALIFGEEQDPSGNYFSIGKPLDMDTSICIDLEKLTERSNGIFGKTGTGKTFITRLILAGLLKQEKASLLIFDMHSEYGLQARTESTNKTFVKGLKTLFPEKIAIFSLDPVSTRRRGLNPDVTLTFSYNAVHVDDILSLQNELCLHATAVEAAYLIAAKYKKEWLSTLLSQGSTLKEFAHSLGAHPESIAALYRKLKRIEHLPFFSPQGNASASPIDQIIEYFDKNISVIIEFGNYTSSFIYLLIANMITRRIHTAYIAKTEHFLGTQKKEDEPKKLMICIEEAHKFLNSQAANQTIFGTIAREMRKYYVSLLIVDQRPSGIDQEILSQIGTKIIAQLHDEKDIQATLTGISNAASLKTVLSTLDSKKQALVLGHAITMPVVVQTREYDEQFYQQMAPERTAVDIDNVIQAIF